MQIPNELVVFGRTYNVRNVSPIHNPEGVLGLASYREGVIYLDEEMDLALTLNTIWHEAAHVAQQEILGATDEAEARWIAVFVHTFLVNNPAILDCYRYGLEPSPFEDDEENNE